MSPHQNEELPLIIAERLRARDRSVPVLTPQVDRTVMDAARTHFAARPARRAAVYRRWNLPAAAAAAMLLALLWLAPSSRFGPDEARLTEDIDGSGRVDVLDAFALARLRASDPGRVRQEDIDALMARIVSLDASTGTL